jgi:alpha-L-fucosidase
MANDQPFSVPFRVAGCLWAVALSAAPQGFAQSPTRPLPAWYDDAKLGIFVHWGVYSVPGWAPTTGELGRVDWQVWFRDNPYAEWYQNTLRIADSPTRRHHLATYGEDFAYHDFAAEFARASAGFDPAAWAELFERAGARYVVLTTKHHDGYTLWPSAVANPRAPRPDWRSARDLVGDLLGAVRARGLRMGLYYSGGLDWTFDQRPVRALADLASTAPQTEEYGRYVRAHYDELIERYRPDVLWNDISYPRTGGLADLLEGYWRAVPEGVVNDRFRAAHADFTTPEYRTLDGIAPRKWETCRGLGFSFGWNRNEGNEQVLSERALVHLLADVVSKNGNLLLNLGPMADGTIPALQRERVLALGAWLRRYGEAIYGTRPWLRFGGEADDGTPVRFTRRPGDETIYAIVLLAEGKLPRWLRVDELANVAGTAARVVGGEALTVREHAAGLTIELPRPPPHPLAYAIAITRPPVEPRG